MAVPREYIKYLKAEMEKERPTWFEKICNSLGRFPITIPVGKETEKKVSAQLAFTQTRVKVSSVYSAAILTAILGIGLSIPLFLFVESLFGMLSLGFGLGIAYYISIYPSLNVKYYRIHASSDLLLSILYMVISLRIIPSLENALLFAAINISGPVGRSLKKVAWDMEIGKFENPDQALEFYADTWRQENEEFAESIDIIRTSVLKSTSEREEMYQESIDVLLDRNMERMKRYTAQLTTPVALINYIGIMLPVLTIILFPIMTIFLAEAIKPMLLVVMYNVVLPVIVYWLMKQTLMTRPFSFAAIDISKHPDAHKIGYYKIKTKKGHMQLPLMPIAVIIGGLIMGLGGWIIFTTTEPVSIFKVIGGITITWGIAAAVILFSYFSYRKNIEIKDKIKTTEQEFTEALYQFGLILGSGYSVEASLQKLIGKIKNLKIADLFASALDRIKTLGLTLERAFFDKDLGVIKYYPSKLIYNILKILTESLQKGSATTAMAMMSISNYLKSIRKIEDYMRELLQESTSEMKFMLTVMVPVAAAITIALAALMTNIVYQLSLVFANLTGLSDQIPFSSPTLLNTLVDVNKIIPIEWFSIIVGIYMVEIVFILAGYLSSLQYGQDPLERFKLLSNGLISSMIFLTLISVLVYMAFSGLVNFIAI